MRYIHIPALVLFVSGCATYAVPEESHVYDAAQLMGKHEVRDNPELREFLCVDPARIEWCAAFVNAVLHANDIPGSDSVSQYPLTARSLLQ